MFNPVHALWTLYSLYVCTIMIGIDYETRLATNKMEQQRLLLVLEQWQRMGRARDVQISQLQNENELVQDKCKQITWIPLHVLMWLYGFCVHYTLHMYTQQGWVSCICV